MSEKSTFHFTNFKVDFTNFKVDLTNFKVDFTNFKKLILPTLKLAKRKKKLQSGTRKLPYDVLETKCLENAIILAVYWRKELNKFAHPTTSGKKRRDPNSCRTNARQPSASCDARRSGAEPETANGCIRHKLSFGRVQLHGNSAPNDMCFRLAFSPVLCAMDLY